MSHTWHVLDSGSCDIYWGRMASSSLGDDTMPLVCQYCTNTVLQENICFPPCASPEITIWYVVIGNIFFLDKSCLVFSYRCRVKLGKYSCLFPFQLCCWLYVLFCLWVGALQKEGTCIAKMLLSCANLWCCMVTSANYFVNVLFSLFWCFLFSCSQNL